MYDDVRPNPFWTCAGLLALGVGIIGIVLPLLPTTPLVLLAAFCFGKGSPRLRAWLHEHKRFGPMIEDWQSHGAISGRAKRMAVIAMAATLTVSVLLGLPGYVLLIQALCLTGAASFILTRPSV
ncbi:MAG: YbaN family protein [Paracoccaceae bacterium]